MQLSNYKDLSAEVRSFELLPLEHDFHFEPGQRISVEFELDGQQHIRWYSLSSPPSHSCSFEIVVRYNPSGPGTRYLWGMGIGSRFPIKGPYGSFVLEQDSRASLFVATGTGVAPIRSMLHTILRSPHHPGVALLFGARTEQDLLYREEFTELAARNSHFDYRVVLSRPGDAWPGLCGHVQDQLDASLRVCNPSEVYVCGSSGMVHEVRRLLEVKGWNPAHVHFEQL